MSARGLIGAEVQILGTATVEIGANEIFGTPTQVAFDFGTPSDLHLPTRPGFTHGCRVVVLLTGTVTGNPGSPERLVFKVEDAEDLDGAINIATLQSAIIDDGKLVGDEDEHRSILIGLKMQANRPWVRLSGTKISSTKVDGRAVVLAIPRGC